MADATWVAGDTSPSVFATLTETDGSAKNLTSATGVRFQMRLAIDRRWAVDAPATVLTPSAGTVRYDWVAGDTDTAGAYVSRWQITWSGGDIEHTEPENTITIDPA